MKKFLQVSKKPFVIAVIASVLCIIDALIGGLFVKGGSFMWVAFAFWTVFFAATPKDRIKGFIGTIIGYIAAIVMMLITSSFSLNIYVVSISTLVGVFAINFLVMYLEKTEKFWTNSISGVFVGIMLTFSGFGVGLNPITSWTNFGVMLAILSTYAVLGLLCGFFSMFFTKNKKEENAQEHSNEEKEEK